MSDSPSNPDFRELLRSPYDPDPGDGPAKNQPGTNQQGTSEPSQHETSREGESELPWVPAVVAAALGAFLVGAFVVYAVVAGPADDDVQADGTSTSIPTTTVSAAPVEATGLPDGFIGVGNGIGARVVASDTSTDVVVVAVSTAVAGSLDAAKVEPLNVAYWAIHGGNGADAVPMVRQYVTLGSLGRITVEFPAQATLEGSAITPYLSDTQTSQTLKRNLDTVVPKVLSGYEFDFGDGMVVVINSLIIDDGWGWVEWSTLGGVPAMVDVTVTFKGTDDPGSDYTDPTMLVSAHLGPPTFFGERVPPPLYGFAGSASLVHVGEPLTSANTPTAITLEITATVPYSIVEGTPIPLPPGS